MVGVHIESITWIPTIFLVPYIFETGFKKKETLRYIYSTVFSVALSLVFYISIYYFGHRALAGSNEQISLYFSSGILRMIRNSWLSFIRAFGSLSPFLLIWLLVKNIKTKKVLLAWGAFFIIVSLIGANWQGDFMIRRIIFAAVILSLAIYKYLGKYSYLFILYLIPIILANGFLYFRFNSNIPLVAMQKRIDEIPTGQVLIESAYYSPFVTYDGTILWLEGGDMGKVDGYLNIGKRVFIEKNATTAPYRLLVGDNYHITSLVRVGDSESRFLFEKYEINQFGDNLELKIHKGEISKEAGQPVISYDQSFWGRLNRNRIDYGDIGTWVWALATNHRDPTGWTYKDTSSVLKSP